MTRTPGAPSRLIDRRSTSPSRHTAESGPATRKGSTAKVLPGMVGAEWPREIIQAAPAITTTDRKSTRLNSSHSQISYAVFCLKKKKQQTPRRLDTRHLHALQ